MGDPNAGAATVPAPPKPLHEMSDDELRSYAAECAKASETTTETAPEAKPAVGAAGAAVTETAPGRTLTEEDIAAIAAALKAEPAAPATGPGTADKPADKPAESSLPSVLVEALDARDSRLREDILKNYGYPSRRGIVIAEMARNAAAGTETKPFSEMSMEELRDHTASIAESVFTT